MLFNFPQNMIKSSMSGDCVTGEMIYIIFQKYLKLPGEKQSLVPTLLRNKCPKLSIILAAL